MRVSGTFYLGVSDPPNGQAATPGLWTTDAASAEEFARLDGVVLVAHELLVEGEKANGCYLGTAVGEVEGYKYNPYHDSLGRFARAESGSLSIHGLSKESQRDVISNWFVGECEGAQLASREIILTDKFSALGAPTRGPLSNKMRERIQNEREAAFLLEGIEKGAVQPELHRGMMLDAKSLAALQSGGEFVLPLSSFSKSHKVAEEFASATYTAKGRSPVIVSVRNVKGFDMKPFSRGSAFSYQKEVILAGKFQVTDRSESGGITYIELGLQE